MTIPSARIFATAFLCGLGAACGAKAAAPAGDAGASPADGVADAGADADPVRSPCAAGGSRGTQFPVDGARDRELRLLGAAHGRLFWVAPIDYEIWSMARDGTDMHVIHTAARALDFRLGSDGIYIMRTDDWSIQRIPFEGGAPTLTRVLGHEASVIGDDTDNVYTFDGFGGMVTRIPKAGGAKVELRSASGAYPMLGGSVIWLDVNDGTSAPGLSTGVSRFDGLGSGSPVTLVDPRACEGLRVDATHAVCGRDGAMSTLSVDGSGAPTILTPPPDAVTPSVSGSPPPFRGPLAFAKHGGRDGVLFITNGATPPTSVKWVSLQGGAPIELSCLDGDAELAVDGDDLFLVSRGYVSRVDLR